MESKIDADAYAVYRSGCLDKLCLKKGYLGRVARLARLVIDSDFDESKVNRDERGRFATKSNGGRSLDGFSDYAKSVNDKRLKKLGVSQKTADDAKEKVKQLFDKGQFCIRAGIDAVVDIANGEGRFKNAYELREEYGDEGYDGYLDGDRKDTETTLFGKEDLKPSERPVYGYLSGGMSDEVNDKELEEYGRVACLLKNDSLRERATYTLNDTLASNGESAAGSVDNTTLGGFDSNRELIENLASRKDKPFKSVKEELDACGVDDYIDMQFHGGVTLDDIETMLFDNEEEFYDNISDELLDLFAKKGIKVFVKQDGEYEEMK